VPSCICSSAFLIAEDDNVDFQLSSASTLHISSSASKCTRALLFCCCARCSARNNFPRRDNFHDLNERKSREEYDEILRFRWIIDCRLFDHLKTFPIASVKSSNATSTRLSTVVKVRGLSPPAPI